MRRWFSMMVLISITPSISIPAEAAGEGYGLGLQTCGEFAKSYVGNPTVVEDTYFTWAEGFMSGLNFVTAVYKMPGREFSSGDISMQSYQSYIRAFCNQHPMAQYLEAVFALYSSLPLTQSNSSFGDIPKITKDRHDF